MLVSPIALILVLGVGVSAEGSDALVQPLRRATEGVESSVAHDIGSSASQLQFVGWSERQPCSFGNDCVTDDCPGCTDECLASCCRAQAPVRLRFSIPGWIPEVHGDATVRGVDAPVNISTRDLFKAVDDLNFSFVGRLEADAGRWGLLADGLYANLSAGQSFVGNQINASAGLENAVVDALVTYDLFDEEAFDPIDASAELLVGARYWLVGGDVMVSGPQGNSVSASGSRQWVDPIVGARVATPITDVLLMRLRADIGGFGAASDFSWNIEAVGEYRCSECCGLQLGYRVLDVDYARGDGFAYDVNYRGPVATIVFDF